MQSAIDSLLVALLVALAPETDSLGGERLNGSQFGLAPSERRARAGAAGEAVVCQQFADIEARRKCTIRTGRASSGAGGGNATYPETVIWMAPIDPGMPFKFKATPQR